MDFSLLSLSPFLFCHAFVIAIIEKKRRSGVKKMFLVAKFKFFFHVICDLQYNDNDCYKLVTIL